MVVGAHIVTAGGFHDRVFGERPWLERLDAVGQTGVDLFFIVSGFIMVVTTARAEHGGESARRFLGRRITRIYLPYLVITAAIFALYVVRPDLVNSSQDTPPDVAASFLLLPQEGAPLLLVGWTLVFEMYFYLVFTLAMLAPRRAFPYILGAWALVTALLGLLPQTNPYVELAASPLNFEFLFGVVIGWLFTSGRLVAPGPLTAAGTVGAFVTWVVVVATGGSYASDWVRVFTTGLLLAVLTYGLVGLEQARRFTMPSWTVRIGDWSYSLYLTHVLALKVLALVLAAAGLGGLALEVLSVPVAFGVAVVGGALYFGLVERPLLRVLHDRVANVRGRRSRHVATSDAA